MTVEYALLLVVITGAVAGVLGLGLDVSFERAKCVLEAAMNGGSCDGDSVSNPVPTTAEPGPEQTGAPPTQAPLPGGPTPPCESTSPTTSGPEPSASGCPTSSEAD
jgi:hypothetical protein